MCPRDPVDVLAAPDPVHAFRCAHRTSGLLALPTSGSIDRPRTVLRTTASWVDSFQHVSRLLEIDPGSRVWIPGPLSGTMNLFAVVHADWAGAERVSDLVDATHAHLTPSALKALLTTRPQHLNGVHVLTTGDWLAPATYKATVACGARVSHYYGAAELSFVAWGANAQDLRPFPRVEVTSRSAELWVRSPYVCLGYRETRYELRRDADGWTTVGDRGTVLGGRVAVHGRDGAITTGGATVMVSDVERALQHAAHGEVVVIGLPHPDLGEVVAVVLTDPTDVSRLRARSRALLAAAHQPRRWIVLDGALPITAHGKVDRPAILRTVIGRLDPSTSVV